MWAVLLWYPITMKPASEIAETFTDAYELASVELHNLARTVNAALMLMYPNRDLLVGVAHEVKTSLNSASVEVNVLVNGKQCTLVAMPNRDQVIVSIRDRDSLCVLTVLAGEALKVDDINHEKFLEDHSVKEGPWGSWCSVPIELNGVVVGTVCALEEDARTWDDKDEKVLQHAAEIISKTVENWARSTS